MVAKFLPLIIKFGSLFKLVKLYNMLNSKYVRKNKFLKSLVISSANIPNEVFNFV